jgi:hypothetical protein
MVRKLSLMFFDILVKTNKLRADMPEKLTEDFATVSSGLTSADGNKGIRSDIVATKRISTATVAMIRQT